MTNSPNSSPEMTEVERSWERCPVATNQCTENECKNGCSIMTPYPQALSSKNELPSEIEGLLKRLTKLIIKQRDERGDSMFLGEADPELAEARQTILSLQRRLDERDALLREARSCLVGDWHMDTAEAHVRTVAKIDAALNPKDTGQCVAPSVQTLLQ